MRLRLLGTDSRQDGSPTLYATDRGTYVVQGWRVPDQVERVEIPYGLLQHLEIGTCLGTPLHDSGGGNFTSPGHRSPTPRPSRS
jgi:hypothetical protein